MKNLFTILLLILFTNLFSQQKKAIPEIFFIDSTQVSTQEFRQLDPKTVSLATVYTDSVAVAMAGEKGRNGILYIETHAFVKKRFQNLFRKKSKEYNKKFPDSDSDKNTVYILNDTILKEIDYGNLALIDEKALKSIKIIGKKELKNSFSIIDKEYGVIIEATETEKK